jgi:hypothetical protein
VYSLPHRGLTGWGQLALLLAAWRAPVLQMCGMQWMLSCALAQSFLACCNKSTVRLQRNSSQVPCQMSLHTQPATVLPICCRLMAVTLLTRLA